MAKDFLFCRFFGIKPGSKPINGQRDLFPWSCIKGAFLFFPLVAVGDLPAFARKEPTECPKTLTAGEIETLKKQEKIVLNKITFIVDGGSKELLKTIKPEDFSGADAFKQQHGRTTNCWLKLKGGGHLGLRER